MKSMYVRFAVMTFLSFVSMYVLMFGMVDGYDDIYLNLDQLYMAAAMTAPMMIFEIVIMWAMYESRIKNVTILALSVIMFCVSFTFMRSHTGGGDEQLLRSMIPHHGGAVQLCNNRNLEDPEVRDLCREITALEQKEIAVMKTKLTQLNHNEH